MQLRFFAVLVCLTRLVFCSQQLNPVYAVIGNSPDGVGRSVAVAGDVNGDGFQDIVIGAPNAGFVGCVLVISGATGSTLFSFFGDSNFDRLGKSVNGAGDVNGDGFDDVIAGAPQDDNNGPSSGSARVYSGFDGSILYTFNGLAAIDYFGSSVAAAGDMDQDGFDDVIVGATGVNGRHLGDGAAYVFSGFDGAILMSWVGDSNYENFGNAVDSAGDFNNDGFDDVIVGINGHDDNGTNSGLARVYSGADGTILASFPGLSAHDQFGFSVAGVGDVNSDGFDDVIVGAPFRAGNGIGSGAARVFSGRTGGLLFSFNGGSANDRFGYSVSAAGDVNADGSPDLIVGAPYSDQFGANFGSATIYSGFDGSLIDVLGGDASNGEFGTTVAGGDVNADGFSDVVVGAPKNSSGGVNAGKATIFVAPRLPTLFYDSEIGPTDLSLRWAALPGNVQSVTGTLSCTGATSGGMGIFGVSLAKTQILIFGIPLLVSVDPSNLLSLGNFGYRVGGEMVIPNMSRSVGLLAGLHMFIQFFESGPVIRASNGIRMLLTP